ncbi:MAG TPA: Cd(II)/Pb(II)-responsive transcriptional regulator [Steroidobacteraceae bacterium]|nr:Cd(II)/Pb(II)-responsive transcriptional regulator [Steroidobacteraceae bacterium]
MSHGITIGVLARRTQCHAETIRYYEREGLLPAPARSQGNYRQYDMTHVERLSFIRHCRSLDMTLDEIRALLDFRDAPTRDCAEVSALLDEHVRHVADRIAGLRRLQRQLKQLRGLCARPGQAERCGILNAMSRASSSAGAAPASGHVHGSHSRRIPEHRRVMSK